MTRSDIFLFAIGFLLMMFVLWLSNGKVVSMKEQRERIDLLESRIEALEREAWPGTMTTETKGACN